MEEQKGKEEKQDFSECESEVDVLMMEPTLAAEQDWTWTRTWTWIWTRTRRNVCTTEGSPLMGGGPEGP